MTGSDEKKLKFQEWVVRFDGKIKQSETLINSSEYHEKLQSDFRYDS